DGYDFLFEASRLPRGVGELLAAEGVLVLRFTGDAVLLRAVFRGARHREAALRVEQRGPQRVFELSLAKPQPGAETADHVGRLAHALHAAGQDDVGFTGEDQVGAAHCGLDTGPAQPVHGECRYFDRQTGAKSDVTRAVDGVGTRLQDVAEHDV